MGLVVAATHLQLEQTVALKFFRGELGTTGEPLMRFMREARAAAQLKSEHVARVLDVGVTEGGTPYMVMEYLEGQGVESVIASGGPLEVASAVEYTIQACEGLAEAHARGIVHRDIKPSNLFLAERSPGWRTIKILDFGISKVSLAQASNITTSLNIVMGTPCYMSPEQFQSAATVDHRTDIWSLGSTLYEMLAGKPPFDPGLPLLAIAEEILNKEPPSLRERRPEVPQELADIIARCMVKDREGRIASAAAMAMSLLPFARARARIAAERAAALTPAFGLSMNESRAAAGRDAGDESRSGPPSGVMWTQIGFASPTTPPAQKSPLILAPPGGAPTDPAALTTGISPADRGGPAGVRIRQPSVASVVIAAALLVSGVIILALHAATPSSRPSMAAIPVAAQPRSTPAPLSTAPASNELVVQVSPPTARIMIDDVMVPGNPYRARFQPGGVHKIQAFANGYESKVQQTSLVTDVVVDLSLDRKTRLSPLRPLADGAQPPPPGPFGRKPPPLRQAPAQRWADPASARPAAGPARPPPATAPQTTEIVDPRGGRSPLHPIETRSPYKTP